MIIQRYILKTVIFATLVVMLIVMGLSFLINLLGELRDIGNGDYGFAQAVLHSALELPHNLYQFFPMLVMLGGLLGLGILASHHELMVIRISGASIRKITGAVFGAAIILIVIGLSIGELLAPQMHYLADKRKSMAQNGGQAVATASGIWMHEGSNFVHVDRVMPHHLEGVTRYEFDNNHRMLASYFVKTMDYQNNQWQLHDMVKTTFTQDHASHAFFANATWNLALTPNLLNVGLVEPEEMSLHHLSTYIEHLVSNGLQATEYQFSFWKRIFEPLTILVMLLLAIPFVFAAPRSVTMGRQMLFGVLVGFTFYILNALVGQLSIVFQLSPIVAALFPTLIFAVLGYSLMGWLRK